MKQELINKIDKEIELTIDRSLDFSGPRLVIYALGLRRAKEIIKETADKWIPVSERLPSVKECQENDCRFIVSDKNRIYQGWFDYVEGYFLKDECNRIRLKADKCVIAWMPLPEPYREEQHD